MLKYIKHPLVIAIAGGAIVLFAYNKFGIVRKYLGGA